MNTGQLQTVSVIVGLAVSVVTVLLLIRSNTREQVRQRQEERDRAVTDARAPLIAEVARLEGQALQYRAEIQRRDDRITQLEDVLWNRNGGTQA